LGLLFIRPLALRVRGNGIHCNGMQLCGCFVIQADSTWLLLLLIESVVKGLGFVDLPGITHIL
jgi:hypothetical protein